MPNNLKLDSLEIRQLRGLRELRIDRLGRANLIVGKNGVGKSTILEALRLYANPADLDVLLNILESREEIDASQIRRVTTRESKHFPIETLFHGRNAIPGSAPIRIGPMNSGQRCLTISLEWFREDAGTESGQRSFFGDREKESIILDRSLMLKFEIGSLFVYLPVSNYSEVSRVRRLGRFEYRIDQISRYDIPLFFVSANNLSRAQIGRLWDNVALTELEKDVLSALRIIAPEIERIAFVAYDEFSRDRAPVVKIAGYDAPLTLKSMGDGVNRLFGIILALVNAKGGLLLIDEIENGIHYSVQADHWRLIFQVAKRLNVQVFATTHSYDCIRAFQQAAEEDKDEEGVLIRLARKGDQLLVAEFDEQELETAVEGQIEVR